MMPATREAICAHAAQVYPRESCGVILIRKGREQYYPCRNLSVQADQFELHYEDYAAAEEVGAITAIVHSHPSRSAQPSQADLVGCENSGLPWVIVSWPTGTMYEWTPTGYQAPLIGRVFTHGRLDCYTLIRDYYQRELGIALPEFARRDHWWTDGQNLYRDNFEAAGFVTIAPDQLRRHDVILIQLGTEATNPKHVPNHGAVYVGDGVILHHPMNRLSGRDVFGGLWLKQAMLYLRHRECA